MIGSNNYILTKTKITHGLKCKKKLWFDINEPITNDSARARLGTRYEQLIKKKFGKALDLSNSSENSISEAIEKTKKAISSKDIKVIFEGHFSNDDTLVRTDILKRNRNGWDLYEIKASGEIKKEYIQDIAIQSFVAKSCGIKLTSINIIYINKEFEYLKDQDYQGLDKTENITDRVVVEEQNINQYIETLKKVAKKKLSPEINMGSHCNNPPCNYSNKCKSLLPKTTWEILPNLSQKKKDKFEKENIVHLKDIKMSDLTDRQISIQNVHISGVPRIEKEKLKENFAKFKWPLYFMDFEFVHQIVPLVQNTRPLVPLIFQWSIHKWDSLEQEIKLENGCSFLKFQEPGIERDFIESLLKTVGKQGSIICHHKSAEISQLNNLKKYNHTDLSKQIDSLIDRIIDTELLVKDCFYSPKMNGKYSLKQIIKAIPKSSTNISYEEGNGLQGGTDAELAWVICTDPNTSNIEKLKQKKNLKEYCAKDTFAMHDIVKYLAGKAIKKIK